MQSHPCFFGASHQNGLSDVNPTEKNPPIYQPSIRFYCHPSHFGSTRMRSTGSGFSRPHGDKPVIVQCDTARSGTQEKESSSKL